MSSPRDPTDWLRHDSEIQFYLNSSVSEPLRLAHANNLSSNYVIGVQAKALDSGCKSGLPIVTTYSLDSASGCCVSLGPTSCPYKPPSESLLWKLRVSDYTYFSYLVDVYDSEKGHVGRACVMPQQLSNLEGTLLLTLHDSAMEGVGLVSLDYFVALPCAGLPVTEDHNWRHQYWTGLKEPILFGHRGNGSTFRINPQPVITENTIESFEVAFQQGAAGVEFDVQLTKDLVPVIYHDFGVSMNIAMNGSKEMGSLCHSIKDLTHEQLQTSQWFSTYTPRHLLASGGNDVKTKVFSRLSEVLEEVPPSLKLMVEVKYPILAEDGGYAEYLPYINRNTVADTVLSTLYRHGNKLNMVLATFDPALCTMLRLKQPSIPVFFLSQVGAPDYSRAVDRRDHSVQDAIAVAKSQDLMGISVCATTIVQQPHLMQLVRDSGLVLMTWGSINSDPDNVALQRNGSKGAHVIMCDRLPAD